MVITYYGLSCFKVSSGEITLAFDPPLKKSSLRSPRFQADIVLLSREHENQSGDKMIAEKDDLPLKIKGPGEYEIRGVNIFGIPSYHDESLGKTQGLSTIYVLELEDLRLCHLGDFGEKNLRAETQEAIGRVDILFLPIGAGSVMNSAKAIKIANQLEPKIIIPMYYGTKELDLFLKEAGLENSKPEEKLTLKKKDPLQDKTVVRVLKPTIN